MQLQSLSKLTQRIRIGPLRQPNETDPPTNQHGLDPNLEDSDDVRLNGSSSKIPEDVTLSAWRPVVSFQDGVTDGLNRVISWGIHDLSSELELIGRRAVATGTNSTIWRGKLSGSNYVAVKRKEFFGGYRKKIIKEFLQEAYIWTRAMHHEHILPLIGVARIENSLAFVSPWMEGGDLGTYMIAHPQALSEPLLADVACGMSYLHSKGIAYGMLQLSTVLVSGIGRAYLSSFVMAYSARRSDYSPPIWPNAHTRSARQSDDYRTIEEDKLPRMLREDVIDFGNTALKIDDLRQVPSLTRATILSGRQPLSPHSPSRALWELVQECLQESSIRPSMAEVARTMVQLAEAFIVDNGSNATAASLRALEDISSDIKKVGEHPIAGGGYCDLYLGERASGEVVALKLVRLYGFTPEDIHTARHRFLTEASLWAEFQHPRILKFYGICKRGPSAFFMVAPYLKHGNITQFLSSDPDSDRLGLLSETAEGLLYLHLRQIVHGDLKGANILITAEGKAVLADFGLSKISHEATTTRLQGAGSPRWMAPELVLAGDEQDGPLKTPKSDIYAYGHVMLEVLSSKLPFFNLKEDLHVIVELIRGGRSLRPDGSVAEIWLNDASWEFSRQCTAIRPQERPEVQAVVSFMRRLHADNISCGDRPNSLV